MSKKTSLYKKTNSNTYYLGYYKPINIPFDSSDIIIIVDSKYNHKPGKLAYDLYNNERLGWVFSYFNRDKINDIIFDLNEGMSIRIPTKQRLYNYL